MWPRAYSLSISISPSSSTSSPRHAMASRSFIRRTQGDLVLDADLALELERGSAFDRVRREPGGDEHLFEAELARVEDRA